MEETPGAACVRSSDAQASVVYSANESPAYVGSWNCDDVTTVAMAASSGTSAIAHCV